MRVSRSFVFLDLCGFTAYTESRGDREAVAIVALLRSTLRASAERHGVRVTKWLGDGAMLSGVDPHHVAACAVEVRDAIAAQGPLPLRGGLAEGPVILFEGDDYIGAAVNTAARLAAAAAPNQLLAAAPFAVAVRDVVAARSCGEVVLRGLGEAVAVCDLGPALPEPEAPADTATAARLALAEVVGA
jgi:class 3 adenylate cyclase